MPKPNLSDEIDYSAFQEGQGGANAQLIIQSIFEERGIDTYRDIIFYLNSNGGLDQRTAYSRKNNVPSSFLSFRDFGPKRALALIEHLEQKGLLKLLKKSSSRHSRSQR